MSNEQSLTSQPAHGSERLTAQTRDRRFTAGTAELDTDRNLYRVFLVVGDALVLFVAVTLAYWLRFQVGIAVSHDVVPSPVSYLALTAQLIAIWLITFAAFRLYDFHHLLGGVSEYGRVVNACTVGAMIMVVVSFVDTDFVVARGWLVMSWALTVLLVNLYRFVLRRIAYRARAYGHFVTPALIVGVNAEAQALAEQFRDPISSGVQVLGYVTGMTAEHAPGMLGDTAVVGDVNDLPALVKSLGIREVIVVPSDLSSMQLVEVSQQVTALPHVDMRLSSGLYEVLTTGMRVTTRNSVPLMSVSKLRLNHSETILKSALDRGLILLAMPLLAPLFLIIALLVRLDSPGPVFYRRRVLGVGGKEFDAFKFRTMYVNGDEILAQHPELLAELQRNHKLKNDPRVTRMGQFLRHLSLDELPQLINVFRGEMSLVGPRMISPAEGAKYGRMRMNLLTVKPGLTGLWQVSGRSNLTYEERVSLDMYYVRRYSIWLDIQILFFQTLPAVVKGRGAF